MTNAECRMTKERIEILARDFDLEKTLDSGQVFHWEKIDNRFVGTIGDVPVSLEQHGDLLRGRGGAFKHDGFNRSSFRRVIAQYFALDHPLTKICSSFPDDPAMKAAREFCRGLRIIRQPKWECLATFICSSMKQVAHIRQISLALRRRFGEPRTIMDVCSIQRAGGGSAAPRAMPIHSASPTIFSIERRSARSTNSDRVFTFPSAERIAASSDKELRKCALGYRAKNLLATARLVASGDVDLEVLSMLPDGELRQVLCTLPGVGAKVANCVMLFAYERLRAFPIDVWIERVLREKYFPQARRLNVKRLVAFTERYFGEHGGYAQQYLFHHARKTGGRRAVGQRPTTARVSPARNDKCAGVR